MGMIEDTLAMIRMAHGRPMDDPFFKAWTQSGGGAPGSTGLVYYDLQAPAKKLYPVITPLRNRIPRVGGDGGTASNWKAITQINTEKLGLGVGEGRRGGVIKSKVVDYTQSYKGLGLEENLTFESEYAAKNFDDVRARASEGLLRAFMIAEEQIILGGNSSYALGTCPTPSALVEGAAGTGSIPTTTAVYVRCVALTHEGFYNASVADGVKGEIIRSDADGSTTTYGGGASQMSNAVNASTTHGTSSFTTKVAPVRGAFAYAWFWGTSATAATLGAITTVNNITITTATGSGTQAANDAVAKLTTQDNSTNTSIHDGLLTFCSNPTGNSYYNALVDSNGVAAPLSVANGAGIPELDVALRSFWDNYRVSPGMMICNAQEINNITKKIVVAGSAPLIRLNIDAGAASPTLHGGVVIGSYLNKFTMTGGQVIPIMLHPNIAPGTILFYTDEIPYPLSNVSNVVQIKTRRDYYQIDWPLKTRRYEFGVYADQMMEHYFPPCMGMITNIADG